MYSNPEGGIITYTYDNDDRVISETHEEKDGDISNRICYNYDHAGNLTSQTDEDSEKAKTYYHYASDELGSTTHLTDENGNVYNYYEYDAFGNFLTKAENVPNRFCFTGEQYDPLTSQYYLRARFYNPAIGRFLNEDTYYGDGLNLYAYCGNNPVDYVDPNGHWRTICDKKYGELKQKEANGEKLSVKEKGQIARYEYAQKRRQQREARGGNKSGSKTYTNSSDITKDIRQNKPLNSPNIDTWYEKNGSISIDKNGVWTYHDWEGNSVSYPEGYPDFKSAGLVRQEAPIGPFVDRNKDFAKARELGYIKSADGTWHHHEDGVTLQEVETILHDRFRHRGGISKLKKK